MVQENNGQVTIDPSDPHWRWRRYLPLAPAPPTNIVFCLACIIMRRPVHRRAEHSCSPHGDTCSPVRGFCDNHSYMARRTSDQVVERLCELEIPDDTVFYIRTEGRRAFFLNLNDARTARDVNVYVFGHDSLLINPFYMMTPPNWKPSPAVEDLFRYDMLPSGAWGWVMRLQEHINRRRNASA